MAAIVPFTLTPPLPGDGKPTRYPEPGDRCDICRQRLQGQTLSLVAVLERLLPEKDGGLSYDGPRFWALTYFCGPRCASSAPLVLEAAGIAMTEPGESLITRCAKCGTLTDRTKLVTNLVLDSVKVGGVDDDVKTLFDFATLCRSCSPWGKQ